MDQPRSNILPLPTGTFFISLRQDFLLLCQSLTYRKSEKSKSSPHCKAFILSILEHWTNYKIDRREILLIQMSIPQWMEALYGLYSYNVIADSLEELTKEGLISREKFKTNTPGKDQYRYLLNIQEMKSRLQTFTNHDLQTEQTVTSDGLNITNDDLHVKNDDYSSTQTVKSNGCIDSNNLTKSNTEEENTSSSIDPYWLLWCQSRSPGKKAVITPLSAKNLLHCQNLAVICQEIEQELTVDLILAVDQWSCKEHGYKKYWLGNLVNDLPEYLKEQSTRDPEEPALSDEELDRVVLWTRWPHDIDDPVKRWNLYEMMTLREAKKHEWDYWTPVGESGPLSEEEITTIQYTQQRECITMV